MIFPIIVQGDYQLTVDVLQGFVAQYDSGIIPKIAGILLVAGLILWSVKYGIDNERNPHPAKEFIIGFIVAAILVVPGLSPRFTVQVVPVNQPLNAVVVDRVPMLAALPAWAASAVLGSLARDSQVHFGDIYNSPSTLSQLGRGPIEALVKLHDVSPYHSSEAGLTQTMNAFIQDCYIQAHRISNINVVSIEGLKGAPVQPSLWGELEPNNSNWLTTTNFMTQPADINVGCREVHQAVASAIGQSEFENTLTEHFDSLGVNIQALGLLPHVFGDFETPTPQQLMIGRFIASRLNETLGDSQLATAFGRSMFEAQQQRLYRTAGEANLFSQIAIPLITTLESFVFFIAPVMMLLSVLGGLGLAYVGKYLMILLFTNLWSYIAVFVAALNNRQAVRVLSVMEEHGGAAYIQADKVLSYGMIGDTINQLEGSLVVASTMVATIPMLAMFLLYGGVHSLMGVMGKFSGSYDDKSSAPSMVGTSSDGTQTMGNVQIATSSDGRAMATSVSTGDNSGANFRVQDLISESSQRSDTLLNSQASSTQRQMLESYSQNLGAGAGYSGSTDYGDSGNIAYQESNALAQTAAEKMSQGQSLNARESTALAARLGFSFKGLGISAEKSQEMMANYHETGEISETDQLMLQQAFNSMSQSQWADTVSETVTASDSEEFSDTRSHASTYNDIRQRQRQVSNSSGRAQQLAADTELNGQDMIMATNNATVAQIRNGLSQEQENRLSAAGLEGVFDNASTLDNAGGINGVMQRLMNDPTATTLQDHQLNNRITGDMYQAFADNTNSGHGAIMAANAFHQVADAMGGQHLQTPSILNSSPLLEADSESTAGVEREITNGQARTQARVDSLEKEYGDRKQDFVLNEDLYNQFLEELEQAPNTSMSGRNYASLAQALSIKGFENNPEISRQLAEFHLAESGVELPSHWVANPEAYPSQVANGIGLLAAYNTPDEFREGDAKAASFGRNQSDLRDIVRADSYLETAQGRDFLNALPDNERQTIQRSLAAFRTEKEMGNLNLGNVSGEQMSERDIRQARAANELYQNATQGVEDQNERFKAFTIANAVTAAAYGSSTGGDPSVFARNAGIAQEDLNTFVYENYDAISSMDRPSSDGERRATDPWGGPVERSLSLQDGPYGFGVDIARIEAQERHYRAQQLSQENSDNESPYGSTQSTVEIFKEKVGSRRQSSNPAEDNIEYQPPEF